MRWYDDEMIPLAKSGDQRKRLRIQLGAWQEKDLSVTLRQEVLAGRSKVENLRGASTCYDCWWWDESKDIQDAEFGELFKWGRWFCKQYLGWFWANGEIWEQERYYETWVFSWWHELQSSMRAEVDLVDQTEIEKQRVAVVNARSNQ